MKNWIQKENIKLQQQVSNWQEGLQIAGNLLLQNKSINPSYIDDMIQAVKQLGPYIVIAPHIAIGHARPGKNVIKDDISVITLKQPVKFGNQDNDPVNIIFTFCATEDSKHIHQLQQLAYLLEDNILLNTLKTSTNINEIFEVINQ
ncbi:PTS sugar transporter subunit IIA [Terrilactibacillus laevilacticus]|uniref:Ascorbate-specific PTS system EIIA component n=1 Tax=Terrilactibacillus laevilacticus TaxID=1380157 RepID=A0ABW5PNF1_9BACI|nr:PTS sugar transporter subunit IIA [Terrilactibacillus laevilacticus]